MTTLLRFPFRSFAIIALAIFVAPGVHLAAQSVNPIPFVNQPLVPSSVTPGAPGFMLTVNGAQFVASSVVNWNGTPLSTVFVSVRQLMAVVPASYIATARTASVTVSNPAPGGGSSNLDLFSVTNPTTSVAFSTSNIGGVTGAVAVADFDNDGKPDLASIGYDASCTEFSAIFMLLGNGDGTFNKSATCASANVDGESIGPAGLDVAGDFNGDGKTDLVTTVQTNDETFLLTTFLGNGDGTFGTPPVVSSPDFGDRLVSGDFNRDGNLDLAFAGNFGGQIPEFASFLGGGDGTFGEGTSIDNISSVLSIGDYNGDGILDVATVYQGAVAILLGDGIGGFSQLPQQDAPLVNPAFVISADFNGDGILDLAIADTGSNALTILQGNGNGTFTARTNEPSLPQFSDFVTAVDLNGDGKLDLVFSDAGCYECPAQAISIFLGNGDGTFQPGFSQVVGGSDQPIVVADFNGDGRLDLAFDNESNDAVSVLLQTPAKSGVSVSMISDLNPISIGYPVTLFAAAVKPGHTVPTGTITFKQDATILGSAPLVDGQASLKTAFARSGNFPIVASYSGDENNGPKNSQAFKQIVEKFPSRTFLQSTVSPSVYKQAVSLVCSVSASGNPTGTVTFRNGSSPLGTVSLTVNGSETAIATLTKTNLPAGTLSITATYNGDALNAKSVSAPLAQIVSPAGTTTSITSSPNPSIAGQNVKFKVVVSSSTVLPVGTVTFTAGTTILGSVTLDGGKASLTTSALPAGTTTVTATYNGTANIIGSSGSVLQTVN